MVMTFRCNSQITGKLFEMFGCLKKILTTFFLLTSTSFYSLAFDVDAFSLCEITSDYYSMSEFYEISGNFQKALDYIEMVISLTPDDEKAKIKKEKLIKKLNPQKVEEIFLENAPEQILKTQTVFDAPKEQSAPQEKVLTKHTESKNTEAQRYLDLGVEAYERGELNRSIEYLLQSQRLDNNAVVNNNLGMTYKRKDNIKEAIAYFEKAFELDKTYVQPLLNLSLIYKDMKKQERELYYLEKALEANPKEYATYYLLGNYYYLKNNYEVAIAYYYKSVELNDQFFDGYCGLAAALYSVDDYENALKALEQARILKDDSDKVFYALAKTYIQSKEYRKAKYYLEEAMVINPDTNYMRELAKINYFLGNYDKSMELYQMLLADSNKGEIFNDLGLCYYHLGQQQKALEFFEKALKENPEKAIYNYNVAICYKSLGENKKYHQYINDAFKITPNNEQDFVDVSCMYADCCKKDKALETLNKGLEKFPSSKKLYLAKIKFYYANNDLQAYERTKMLYNQKFKKK